jgi:hypothetical protein
VINCDIQNHAEGDPMGWRRDELEIGPGGVEA